MTGYGRGAAERGGRRVTIEIRSVNHRFLDVKLRGGALEPGVEDAVVSRLRERLERGAVTIAVRAERRAAGGVTIDRDAARAAHAALATLATELGIAPPTLDLVIAQPGVVAGPDALDPDDGELLAATTAAADVAISALVAMRESEGKSLARELGSRTAALRALVEEVAALADAVPADVKRKLDDRLRRLLAESESAGLAVGGLDPARLTQEIVLLADRADVTEEIVRLRSHLDQLAAALAPSKAAVGRRLDFLLQEVGRELNTIGSKTPSAEIISRIVAAKVELEKLREQAQNVE
jgi:uncharacterized protein (TIGR00255 family)